MKDKDQFCWCNRSTGSHVTGDACCVFLSVSVTLLASDPIFLFFSLLPILGSSRSPWQWWYPRPAWTAWTSWPSWTPRPWWSKLLILILLINISEFESLVVVWMTWSQTSNQKQQVGCEHTFRKVWKINSSVTARTAVLQRIFVLKTIDADSGFHSGVSRSEVH